MPEIDVRELTVADEEAYEHVLGLLRQLSSSAQAPTPEHFAEVVTAPATRLLLATEHGRPRGMLTLVLVRLTSGPVAYIEDVVVDEAARGRGIGRALVVTALELALGDGARHVDLTSRPSRVAANRLYQSLGFVRRETNAYRYSPQG